jgi:hypothetical protein
MDTMKQHTEFLISRIQKCLDDWGVSRDFEVKHYVKGDVHLWSLSIERNSGRDFHLFSDISLEEVNGFLTQANSLLGAKIHSVFGGWIVNPPNFDPVNNRSVYPARFYDSGEGVLLKPCRIVLNNDVNVVLDGAFPSRRSKSLSLRRFLNTRFSTATEFRAGFSLIDELELTREDALEIASQVVATN